MPKGMLRCAQLADDAPTVAQNSTREPFVCPASIPATVIFESIRHPLVGIRATPKYRRYYRPIVRLPNFCFDHRVERRQSNADIRRGESRLGVGFNRRPDRLGVDLRCAWPR